MRKSRRPLIKNILWWLGYTVVAIWMQFAIAGVDFFMPAVICSMQEEKPRQTFWLITMFALIQEGTGAMSFGSSTLWYCSALILMHYGRWMFDANNFFFIVLVSCALGVWNVCLTLLMANLQTFQVNMQLLIADSCLLAGLIPLVWLVLYSFRQGFLRNVNAT
ncbi:hypothetical protein [Halodesulfovibrio spirochaetisodalis]|uniref:hypothetical protein n=1 Tax=Halodesulfovibrio spirochaetisodalis TaxID=1560234 RepID=UPI000833F816|nr:hypothetical protein [Halodesulfovibrio spirochaetisodalis]